MSNHISVSQVGEILVVTFLDSQIVEGEIAGKVSQKLVALSQNGLSICLDLKKVNFLAESVWGGIVSLWRRLKKENKELSIFGISEEIREKFLTYRLDRLIKIDRVIPGGNA